MAYKRFQIRRDALWAPLLLLFGASRDASYVELEDRELRFRFGHLFKETFRVEDIEAVRSERWSLLGGIGWRTNFFGRIGLIGSTTGVVEVLFSHKRWVRMPFPLPCERISVSMEEPEVFMTALALAAALTPNP